MRPVRVSENFVPVSEFKARAADWLRRIGETDAAVVVTQNGRPAGVVLSPKAFDDLTERARLTSAVREGLADVAAGRVRSHASVAKRMAKRFGAKSQ